MKKWILAILLVLLISGFATAQNKPVPATRKEGPKAVKQVRTDTTKASTTTAREKKETGTSVKIPIPVIPADTVGIPKKEH